MTFAHQLSDAPNRRLLSFRNGRLAHALVRCTHVLFTALLLLACGPDPDPIATATPATHDTASPPAEVTEPRTPTELQASVATGSDSPKIELLDYGDGRSVRAIVMPNGTYVLANGTECRKTDAGTLCLAPIVDGPQPRYQCGSGGRDFGPETYDLYKASNFSKDFLHWNTDNSRLIFGYNDTIWTADISDNSLTMLVDASPP